MAIKKASNLFSFKASTAHNKKNHDIRDLEVLRMEEGTKKNAN